MKVIIKLLSFTKDCKADKANVR